MTTVTAKELRENLSSIIDRAADGEEIVIIRRSKPVVRLVAENSAVGRSKGNSKQILEAIDRYQAYIKAAGIKFNLDPNKTYKQLYSDAMMNDPKYKRYVTKND